MSVNMSAVWMCFTLDTPQSRTATCNVCRAAVPRGGSVVASYNTTNLMRHLKKHHSKELDDCVARREKDERSRHTSRVDSFRRQQGKVVLDNVEASGITEKLINFIVMDEQPLSVVENRGFRSLMQHLQPTYSLPSRRYLSETALPELYNRVSTKLAAKLKGAPALSFTAHIWTADVCPVSVLSLTVRWVDSHTHGLCSALLQVKTCRGSHNTASTSASITQMFNQWEIPLEKVHVILRDEAAVEDMAVPSLACFAHTLQLVVHEGVLSQRSVSDALANSRKIVGHFTHSQLAQCRLEDLQRELQGAGTMSTPTRLVPDVATRWISSYDMIKSLLTEKRPLVEYAADHTLPGTLTANQWGLLEKTVTVLEPFEELTRKLSSATSSAADVIPAVTVLKRLLADSMDSGTKTLRRTLLQAVRRRFDGVESEPLYAVATLVDARYKDRFFSSGENTRRAKGFLTQELENMEQAQLGASTHGAGAEPAAKIARMEAGPSAGSSCFSSLHARILEEHDEPARGNQQTVVVQMHIYLTEPTTAEKDCPFQYWANNIARFPLLGAVAAKFLSAPSTSVESERLFSTASNIVDEKRNRLTAERAEMLIFLKKNLPIFS